MWIDVSELHGFYETDLGAVAQQVLRTRLGEFWPDVQGQVVAACGYGIPFLDLFRGGGRHVFAMMPAQTGAIHWPEARPNLTVLCDETQLPLADQSVDKLLVIHALEHTFQVDEMMREFWRVLKDGGEMLIVVPNRRGMWARTPRTPFGNGYPYTGYQLFRLVEKCMFAPEKPVYALFVPPVAPRFFSSMYEGIESFGRRWGKKLGGVVIIRARKTVLAVVPGKEPRWENHIFVPATCNVRQ